MPDVEFSELRDSGNRLDIIERQAMARMRFDAIFGGQGSRIGNAGRIARSNQRDRQGQRHDRARYGDDARLCLH